MDAPIKTESSDPDDSDSGSNDAVEVKPELHNETHEEASVEAEMDECSSEGCDDNEDDIDPKLLVIKDYLEKNLPILVVRRAPAPNQHLVIYNKNPDKFLAISNNLKMIIQRSDNDIILTIYTFNLQVWKDLVIPNFDELQPISKQITTLFYELSENRYNVCVGGFSESSYFGELSVLDPQSLYIERLKNLVVYRSRDCATLVRSHVTNYNKGIGDGTGMCEHCNILKDENLHYIKVSEKDVPEIAYDGDDDITDSHERMSDYLEVNIDDNLEVNMDDSNGYNEFDEDVPFGDMTKNVDLNWVSEKERMNKGSKKFSYKSLIMMAIRDSREQKLKLNDIYEWIMFRFPHYRLNKAGFQNSVRHNLSLNKIFKKMAAPEGGKGHFWTLRAEGDEDDEIPTSVEPASRGGPGRLSRPPLSLLKPRVQSPPTSHNPPLTWGSSPHYRDILPKVAVPITPTTTAMVDLHHTGISHPSQTIKQEPNNDKLLNPMALQLVQNGDSNQNSIPLLRNPLFQQQLLESQQGFQEKRHPVLLNKSDPVSESRDSQPVLLRRAEPEMSTSPDSVKISKTVTLTQRGSETEGLEEIIPDLPDQPFIPYSGDFKKPPFSYKELIMLALSSTPERMLPLSEIYHYIKRRFPYYSQKIVGVGWQNSIRHNLSLIKSFSRVHRLTHDTGGTGKGGLWTFDPKDSGWQRLQKDKRKMEFLSESENFDYLPDLSGSMENSMYDDSSQQYLDHSLYGEEKEEGGPRAKEPRLSLLPSGGGASEDEVKLKGKGMGEPIIYQGKHIGWKTDFDVDPLDNGFARNSNEPEHVGGETDDEDDVLKALDGSVSYETSDMELGHGIQS